MNRLFLLSFLVLGAAVGASAQSLDALTRPRDGRIVHIASTDPTGGNGDLRGVAPGQTLTLVDYKGAGTVRRWWVTIAPRNQVAVQRQGIIRCYWDGETTPSVECPVSDFFGMGFGEWKDFQSLPLSMTSGGYNCYWPMPFSRSCKITFENRSPARVDAFYYNIDIETTPKPPKDPLYFHAQFRRTRTERGKPVTILKALGRGHYVGTVLSMQFVRGRGLGFLEGDEQVFVDGEAKPSIVGTGTEDYFNSGWYFDTGAFSAPQHGAPIKDTLRGRISAYRWHISDPIPFTQSLTFQIEHGGVNDAPPADYCSVAFWYQTHPRAPLTPLPAYLLPLPEVPVFRIPGILEGEGLIDTATVSAGNLDIQDMSVWDADWSNAAQLWWLGASLGARLTLSVPSTSAGEKEVVLYITRAVDYGDFTVRVNGVPVGGTVSGYSKDVVPSGAVVLGKAAFKAGANTLILEIVGKDDRSKGYLVGIDGIVLR
jgi:hypothetical protein